MKEFYEVGREGDLIRTTISDDGTEITTDIDPAIQRRMPTRIKKESLVDKVVKVINKVSGRKCLS